MVESHVIVLGSINLDVQLVVATLPLPGETIRSLTMRRGLGGKGANQAVAASRAGAPTSFRGAVGAEAGILDLIRQAAPQLDISGIYSEPDCETGAAYILVSQDGENQIVTAAGANERLSDHGDIVIDALDICLAQLEVPVPAIMRFFAAAQRIGALTVLNAAPALDEGRALLDHTDLLIVNETELAYFAGEVGLPGDDIGALASAASGLRSREDQTIIVTLGANGVLIVGKESLHLPGRPVVPVDTTGAGDCFCGVLCAALAGGADIAAAAARANVAASLQVGRAGAAEAMPWSSEIDATFARLSI